VAVRPVLVVPDPALKRVAAGPDPDDREAIARIAADLVDTMRGGPSCVGLAAPQIAEPVRMVVVDCSAHPKAVVNNGLLVLVDPVVVASSGAEVAREGCFSIPHLTANVRRATHVTIEALDAGAVGKNEPLAVRRIDAEGFEARCLLHEIDHLDGILFLDRVDSLARDVFRRKGQTGPKGPKDVSASDHRGGSPDRPQPGRVDPRPASS
jgi:peptide deformylase